MTENMPIVNLRAIEPEDLDVLYGIENDESLWNVSVTNVPYSRYTLYDYIANNKNDIYSDRQVRLMIEDINHKVVGIVDIINFDPKNLRAEVGIVIKREFRNKGFAFAAISRIKEYSLYILHLHQLYACVDKNNEISVHVFERCGFARASELKDWLYDGKVYHDALLMQLFL